MPTAKTAIITVLIAVTASLVIRYAIANVPQAAPYF